MTLRPPGWTLAWLLAFAWLSSPAPSVAEDAGGALARGQDLFAHHRYEEAIEAYSEALRLDPHNFRAYLGRARVYGAARQPDLAEADYDRAVEADPAADEPLLARAIAHYSGERLPDVILDLDAAIRLNPSRIELYHWRGCAHAELNQDEQAAADFTEVLAHDPGNQTVGGMDYFNRGAVRFRLGRKEEALADYERAEAAGDPCATRRGDCLLGLNRFLQALAVYDTFLESLGDNDTNDRYDALRGRAQARTGLKDFEGAAADLLAAIALKPDDAHAYGSLAWVRLLANRPAEARRAALQGLVLDDTQEWIRLNLAHTDLFEGRFDQAKAYYLKDKDEPRQQGQHGKTHGQIVLEDFADFRAAGIDRPEMAAIEDLLRAPPTSAARSTPVPAEQ